MRTYALAHNRISPRRYADGGVNLGDFFAQSAVFGVRLYLKMLFIYLPLLVLALLDLYGLSR